ncbi:MAG: T9SS type A sorting domain-containing protein [Tenuifilaceae bacterium]
MKTIRTLLTLFIILVIANKLGQAQTAFNVTGGGSYCTGGTGVVVGLGNSETAYTYQLYRDVTTAVGSPVSGNTGNPISFGLQTVAGTYTVKTVAPVVDMNGNVVITIVNDPTIDTQPVNSTICTGGTQLITVATSGGTPSLDYQWEISTNGSSWSNTGTNSNNLTTAVLTAQRYYRVTASATGNGCTSVTSDEILVSVEADPGISVPPTSGTICSGGTKALSVTATGGTPSLDYQWEASADGSSGWAAVGTNSSSYTTAALTATNFYRVTVSATGNGCGTAQSSNAQVTVVADPAISVGPSGSTICSGGTQAMTVTTTGGTPSLSHQWEMSSDGSTGWSNVGTNSTSYTTTALTADRYYRVTASASGNGCDNATSSNAAVLVVADPSISTQPAVATICSGGVANLSVVVTGGEGVTYQWQDGNSGTGPWSNVTGGSGGTSNSYTTPTLIANKYYRVVVSASGNGCTSPVNSSSALVTVEADPGISVPPTSGTICSGGTKALSVTATGGTPSLDYQWEASADGSSGWAAVGTNSSSYTTAALTATNFYRVTVSATGNGCGTAQSSNAQVTVVADPAISVGPSGSTICSGGTQAMTVTTTGGTPSLSHQWEMSSDGSTGWSNVGTNSTSYTTTALTADRYYRVTASASGNGCDNATSSNAAVLVVADPSISTQPAVATICSGGVANLSVVVTGGEGVTYQWQDGNSGTGPWSNVTGGSGGTSNSYTTPTLIANKYYRVVVSASGNGCTSPVNSSSALVTVEADPGISVPPTSGTICSGGTKALSVTATGGTPSLDYQWEASADGSSGWAAVGTNSSSYTTAALTATNFYRVTVSATGNGCGTAQSSNAQVTVVADPAISVGPSGSTICSGGTQAMTVTTTGGTPSLSHQWEMSSDGSTGWSNVGTNSTSYTTTALTADRYYRVTASASGNGCDNATSSNAAVLVVADPSISTQPAGTSICSGGTNTISVAANGGTPSLNYQWEISDNGTSGWTNVGLNSDSYATGVLTLTKYYRVTISATGNGCNSIVSSNSQITVVPDPSWVSYTFPVTEICIGGGVNFSVDISDGLGGDISWIRSISSGGAGSTVISGDNPPSTTTYYYRPQYAPTGVGCNLSDGTETTVNVSPQPIAPVLTKSPNVAALCEGNNVSASLSTAGSGGTGCSATYEYSYDNSGTWNSYTLGNPVTTTGHTKVDIRAIWGGCGTGSGCIASTNTYSWTIYPNPTASITPVSPSTCASTWITLTATPAGGSGNYTTYAWTNTGASSLNTTSVASPSFYNSTDGTYPLLFTITDDRGCQGTASTSVVITPAAVGGSIAGSDAVCSGTNSTLLTLSGHTGTIVRWESSVDNWANSSIISNTNTTYTATNLTTTTKYRAYIQNGTCSSAYSSVATVTVNQNPTATISPAVPEVCAGLDLGLTATPAGGSGTFTTHLWSGAGATYITAGGSSATPTFNHNVAGSYALTYTVTDNNTCQGTATTTVVVNSLPVINSISSNSPVCVGNALNLTSAADRPVSFSWSGPSAYASTIQSPSVSSNTQLTMAGTYNLTVTDGKGCVKSGSTVVVVNALPVVNIGGNVEICANSTLNLTETGGEATSWSWSGPNGFTSAAQNPSIANISAPYGGTYNITINNANCSNTASKIVVVNPLPTATISPSSPSVCAGTGLVLTAIPSGGSGTYSTHLWTDASSSSTPTNAISTTFTNSTPGNYPISYTVTDSKTCQVTANTSVTVNPISVGGTIAGSASVCSGVNSKTLTLSGHAGSIVRWESSIDNWTTHSIVNNTTITNVATNLTQTTKYRALIQNGGCTSVYSSDATITVNSNPTATISPVSPEVCAGLNLNITATPAGGSGTYTTHAWTGTGASSLDATNITNPVFTNSSAGNYGLTYTVTDNNTCQGSATVTVVVNSNPTITVSNNSPVCVGKLLSISGGSDRTVAYSWSGPASYTSSIQSPIVSTSATSAMNGVYSLTVTDTKGCVNNTTTNVTVNALPVFAVSNNGPICKGTPLILTGPPSMITYSWVGPNDYINSTQSPTVSATALTTMSGDYTLTATDNNGCVNSFTTNTLVKPLPTVTATSNGPLCAGFALNLTGTTNGTTYSWAGPLTYTSTTLSPVVSANATTAMTGTYTLTSTLNGCTDFASTNVTVNSLPVIEFTAPILTFNRKDAGVNLMDYVKPGSTGGTFTGEGVGTNGFFYPALVGEENSIVTKTITYTLTNSSNCTSIGTIDIRVTGDLAYFDGFVSSYHYCKNSSATPFTITVRGYETTTAESFSINTPNGWTLDPNDKYKITFDPKAMDPGEHTLSFTYTENSNTHTIQNKFTIELVQVNSVFINALEDKYCKSDPEVVLVVDDYSPLGGTGHFSGPIADVTKASNTITFRPTDMPLNQDITISYYYTSAKGCNSPTISKQTRVNALPVLNFTLKDNYNYDEKNPVLLVGDPIGGGFSSPDNVIINNTTLSPSLTTNFNTNNPITITYSYTDANGCSNTLPKTTKVYKANAPIINLNSTYCYKDIEFDISCNPTIVGNPTPFTGIFTSKKSAITQLTDNTAKYSLKDAGPGLDTIRFSYSINGTPYEIVKGIFIDYFDNIKFNSLSDNYCKDASTVIFYGTVDHFGGDGTGVQKYQYGGPANPDVFQPLTTSASYTPKNDNIGVYTFTYIYKSTYYNSGCTDTITKQVSINPVPVAKFDLAEACPDTENDVYFVNQSTIPPGATMSWKWTFEGKEYTDFEPHYGYKTIGDKPTTLVATTEKGCSSTYNRTITIGVPAKANFTWNNECMDGELISFKNTSDGVSDDESLNKIAVSKWIYNGDTIFRTKNMAYIFPSLGEHKIKLDILTNDGCRNITEKTILIQPFIKFNDLPNFTYYQNFDTSGSYYNWQPKPIYDTDKTTRWLLGVPSGDTIKITSSGPNSWFTNITTDEDIENSQVVSPCFDFTGLKKPMIKLNIWSFSEPKRDGAVLQYSLDKGNNWKNLGTKGEGKNWFNSDNIIANPAGQIGQIEGWSQLKMPNWTDARHNLDSLMGEQNVRFRIAYAKTVIASDTVDGFAFDDVWIGERQQMVLGEYFTNTTTSSTSVNDYLKAYEDKESLDFIPIHYHASGVIYASYTDGPSSRVFYYGVSQVPTIFSNGTNKSTLANKTIQTEFETVNDVESLKDPLFTISFDGVTSNSIEVRVKANDIIKKKELILNCAIVGNTVGDYFNVIRRFLPNPGGTLLSQSTWNPGDYETKTIPVSIADAVFYGNSKLVVFVQDAKTREVYQTFSEDFNNPPPTSIKPVDISKSVVIYPVPASNFLVVECAYEIDRLVVMDITGRIIKDLNPSKQQFTIPVENLRNGLYLIKGTTKKGEFVKKFIKQ